MLEKIISKHKEDYEKIVCLTANELITTYEGLDCEYINERMKEESYKYEELVELLSNRLTAIESMTVAINSVLTSQEYVMKSLKQISEQVDALQINLPCDVTELQIDLQVTILLDCSYVHICDHL